MQIQGVNISCGVSLLINVGTDPRQVDLDNLAFQIRPYRRNAQGVVIPPASGQPGPGQNSCALLIASLNHTQVKAVEFLEANNFKRVGAWITNPNSNNRVAVWIAAVSDEGTPIPYDLCEQVIVPLPEPAPIPMYTKFKSETVTFHRDRKGRFVKVAKDNGTPIQQSLGV